MSTRVELLSRRLPDGEVEWIVLVDGHASWLSTDVVFCAGMAVAAARLLGEAGVQLGHGATPELLRQGETALLKSLRAGADQRPTLPDEGDDQDREQGDR